MDQMVLKAQKWVNATYSSVPGYVRCNENGVTGWNVAFALTRALQHELGIAELSDNFGPTTLGRLTAYGNVGANSSNMNLRTIAEAALYCKGYTGGDIDGTFGAPTRAGLNALAQDMSVTSDSPLDSVPPKMFKAMLTMDAYILLNGGDEYVRQIQQWLNATYIGRRDFFYGPCDGHFSRDVQKALVLAIQYELGMSDDVVTGAVGPGTMAGLKSQAHVATGSRDDGRSGFVHLFKAAMHFNGWDGHWNNGDPAFTTQIADVVRHFQEFSKLPQSGEGDYQTWMSLLLSTGDPDRRGIAFDCMYPLNSTTIATVKNAGYQIVGRYLTGGTNKVLTHSEIALINDNGLSFFPLYQEYGDALQYFSYDQGYDAGVAACNAARGLGIPYGTVVYFSVDFDALDTEITSAVIPHFQGVNDAVKADGSRYAVGVYGCRNVCGRLSSSGLAVRSFVSGMSWGYSGNLGFPLPDNWAFDQITNLTLAPGAPGAVEIDNDIASGRDPGLNSVTRPRDPNDGFYTYLVWLEARAQQWRDKGNTARSQSELVAQYLRMMDNKYNFTGASEVFGELDTGFVDYAKNYQNRPDASALRDPSNFRDADAGHFGASFGAVLNHGNPDDLRVVNLADFGSWAGDLISTLGDFAESGLPNSKAYDFAHDHIAAMVDNGYFSIGDFMADVDAFVLGLQCKNDASLKLSTLFQQRYTNPADARHRYVEFLQRRFGGSIDTLLAAAMTAVGGNSLDAKFVLLRAALWTKNFSDSGWPVIGLVPDQVCNDVATAFSVIVTDYTR